MPYAIDETHDPKLKSWVERANDPQCDFPIQNLPWVEFSAQQPGKGLGVRIGDQILDLHGLLETGVSRKAARPARWAAQFGRS